MSGFLLRRMTLAGLRSLRKASGKLKSSKKVPLKNTKPTTIRGVNIKTKAGKEFGDKVKNQPKLIKGQKPKGVREDTLSNIPSFLKKKSIQSSFTKKSIADSKKNIKEQIKKERVTFKPRERTKAINEAFAKALNEKDAMKAKKMLENIKKMKDGGALKDIPENNKGLPKLPTEVRNKMGFKKDGGLVSATAKLKAQGLKNGGAVRGKARGMGAATKGGGYNV